MKLYTATFDLSKPSPKQIEAPINSRFAIVVGTSQAATTSADTTLVKLPEGTELSATGEYKGNVVFDIETDSNTGVDAYRVVFSGFTTVDINEEQKGPEYVDATITGGSKVAMELPSDIAGKTLGSYTDYFKYTRWDNTNQVESELANAVPYIYMSDTEPDTTSAIPIAQGAQGGKWYTTDYSTQYDTFTFPSSGRFWVVYDNNSNVTSRYRWYKVYFTFKETQPGGISYVNILKKDKGEVYGYKDDGEGGGSITPTDTVTISGTYSDDTPFEFKVVIDAE